MRSSPGTPPQQRLQRALAGASPGAAPGAGLDPPPAQSRDHPPDDLLRAWVVDDQGLPDDPPPPGHRRSISGRAALFAALLALIALVVAVPRVLSSGPDVEPVPPRTEPLPTAATSAGNLSISAPAGTAPADGASTEPGSTVLVHVVGQVRHPGVVRLHAGARLADALRKAGGATRRADLAAVNLARAVVDGEQVFVPAPGQTPPVAPAPPDAAAPGSGASPGAVVDLNTADETELDALPGVGPVIAGRIVAWRQEHGRFSSVEELTEVSGIGDATLERLRPLVRT
jgi:competence protein ComEA